MPATGGVFDQNIPNNEPYNGLNLLRFDANYGIFYKYLERGKKVHPFLGLALAHLTRPHESLTGGDSRLPIKWTGHGGADLKLNDKIDLTPRALFMYQAKSMEFSGGLLLYYRLTENDTKLLAGVDYRINDAVIINLGIKHESYSLRFSYDINNSYLKNYTKSRGAYEISLILVGEKGKPLFRDLGKF